MSKKVEVKKERIKHYSLVEMLDAMIVYNVENESKYEFKEWCKEKYGVILGYHVSPLHFFL